MGISRYVSLCLCSLLRFVIDELCRGTKSSPANATILLESTNLGDKAYQPKPIEIPVSGSVSWTNDDRIAHSVTATEGEFDSGVMQPDEVFESTFDKVGGFEYYCMLHPSMVGHVVVH